MKQTLYVQGYVLDEPIVDSFLEHGLFFDAGQPIAAEVPDCRLLQNLRTTDRLNIQAVALELRVPTESRELKWPWHQVYGKPGLMTYKNPNSNVPGDGELLWHAMYGKIQRRPGPGTQSIAFCINEIPGQLVEMTGETVH